MILLTGLKFLVIKQKSCLINGGRTTHYINLDCGARRFDPISGYLYILVLETLLILTKCNRNIHGIKTFKPAYLYTAYADDTTFFKKDVSSVKIVFSFIDSFSRFSGLAGTGVLKNINEALSGMKNADLTKETIKILDVHISYNKKLEDDLNYLTLLTTSSMLSDRGV